MVGAAYRGRLTPSGGVVRRSAGCLVVAVALAASPGVVQGAELQLEEALARARGASPLVRAAAADVAAARGRLAQARLFPANPVLSADLARHTDPTTAQ